MWGTRFHSAPGVTATSHAGTATGGVTLGQSWRRAGPVAGVRVRALSALPQKDARSRAGARAWGRAAVSPYSFAPVDVTAPSLWHPSSAPASSRPAGGHAVHGGSRVCLRKFCFVSVFPAAVLGLQFSGPGRERKPLSLGRGRPDGSGSKRHTEAAPFPGRHLSARASGCSHTLQSPLRPAALLGLREAPSESFLLAGRLLPSLVVLLSPDDNQEGSLRR